MKPCFISSNNSLTVHYLAAPGQLITYIIVSELGCNVIELYTVIGSRGWSKILWTKEKDKKKKISRLRTNLILYTMSVKHKHTVGSQTYVMLVTISYAFFRSCIHQLHLNRVAICYLINYTTTWIVLIQSKGIICAVQQEPM